MSGITAVELDELLGPAPIAVEDLDVVGPLPKPPKPPTKTFTAGPPQPPSVSVAGKRSPVTTEKLLRLVQYRSETPSAAEACRRAKINVSTLRYWLAQSIDGDPGDAYDIPLNGDRDDNGRPSNTIRFHEAWDDAFLAQLEQVEKTVFRQAKGYREELSYKGRVQYKYDPAKRRLAIESGTDPDAPECYLLDDFGEPVPETINKVNVDAAMFLLKSHKPGTYGNKAQVDVNVKGGVLVVGARAATSEALNVIEAEFKREGRPMVEFDDGPEKDTS